MWEHILDWQTVLTGGVAAIGAYLVAHRQSKAQVATAKAQADATRAQATAEAQADVATASGPNWDMYVNRLEKHFDKRLSEQDRKIESLSDRVTKLTVTIAEVKNLYELALSYIRQLWAASPSVRELLPPPDEIVGDLNTP